MKSEFEIGTSYLVVGETRLAVLHLRNAFHQNPGDYRVRYNYAVALCMSGCRQEALDVAFELPKLYPLLARGYALSALMLETNERFGEATRYYRAAHLLAPHDATICYLLGRDQLVREEGHAGGCLSESISETPRLPLPEMTALAVAGVIEELNQNGSHTPPRVLCGAPMIAGCYVGQPPRNQSRRKHEWEQPKSCEIEIHEAANFIRQSHSVVAITGAGISSPSGLRTRKELWRDFDRDEAVSVWRARESPQTIWTVIKEFIGEGGQLPNRAHHALFDIPNLAGIITQNVDGLHQLAQSSSRNSCPILEIHGTLDRTYCWNCNAAGGSCLDILKSQVQFPPVCRHCGDQLRPDVVLFGEAVKQDTLLAAKRLVTSADVVLVVGCAMDVAPASEFPRLAAASGAVVLEFKRSFSRLSRTLTTHLVKGCAAVTLPAVIKSIHQQQRANRS